MIIHYNFVVWIILIIILISIQYSINKVIVLLKDIKNILMQLNIKDRL
ncbi:hypothetical protein [Tepidibacter thalassicus]|uniref:Uncharacterized protein n=1 Tax=Tepidibacter thalassicus DSM 15285 TaxID=1123350 RepID=A0A1M5PKC6_9FIRM|nr:hypothetical protein [Tepidibacter thalassicus]SHH01653.1 hypothetical protein SAMN02744040_00516 [Tepidibacter thalassicus DSM 15285]